MKVWTVSELENVVASLAPLVGARLQEVQTSEADVVLGFYTPEGILWLWIDLNALRPCLLPWSELPLFLPPRKSPLHLFLKAHFVGRTLRSVERVREHGRLVRLTFGKDGDGLELEVRLFPHGRNILARAGLKHIAWEKPQELSPALNGPEGEGSRRSLEELRAEWRSLRAGKGPGKTGKDLRQKIETDLAKKRKALAKVEEELKRKQDQPWKAVGNWLKAQQNLDVPKEWEPFVEKRRKLSWNIENCYAKAREVDGKIFGTEQRLRVLQSEIARMEANKDKPLTAAALRPPPAPLQPLIAADAQGRTLRLSDEITVVSGKSAADNMKLLRKARAWDLWFHLKDEPSGHAILFRNKSTPITDATLQQVAAWYVRQCLGEKWKAHVGERFLIQMAECRHVRPVKGDRLGRVTVHEERVISYKLSD